MSNPNKYLLATCADLQEPNIAVLHAPNNIVPKDNLVRALSEHFDADVQVNSLELITFYPLTYKAECSMENLEGGVDLFTVDLEETWLY